MCFCINSLGNTPGMPIDEGLATLWVVHVSGPTNRPLCLPSSCLRNWQFRVATTYSGDVSKWKYPLSSVLDDNCRFSPAHPLLAGECTYTVLQQVYLSRVVHNSAHYQAVYI